MEWEAEQLRRGGMQVDETMEKAPKPAYKPVPSVSSFPFERSSSD